MQNFGVEESDEKGKLSLFMCTSKNNVLAMDTT